ncbi:hypothetical protein BU25DRAFT_447028 [Macroventuria anomochaeta]|uniref:Uncharacterized protein n=1 Tax=Macroventuria anomochaeta TaxID=301207 RepID=A0ACB6S8U4_9PLEO|nr:uncharacterized protein BU25DRAFT_447028 [Macroventuria anomochaeta]KAF2629557.1 hypothetical protein BU25DRAFT_447028 [Macroventuria anomochaeta]
MGVNAFESLNCPRIPPDVYAKVKAITIIALQTVFTHVTVPFEISGKADYGDIDILVSAPSGDPTDLTFTTFPFQPVIETIKHALKAPYGRRGFPTPDACISPFACLLAHQSLASMKTGWRERARILGPSRRQDWLGSMVWVTSDPWMVCRLLSLGRRVVDGGFESNEERRFPDFKLNVARDKDLQFWTARTRAAIWQKVFTLFPHVAAQYYTKRSKHVNGVEERRLRDLITAAIPTGING